MASLVMQSHAEPSLRDGFARSAAECDPRYRSLWDGLVGAWVPALGVSGGKLFDVSGYGNHGTLINSPDWVVSENGWAVSFSGGSAEHIEFNASTLSRFTFTWSGQLDTTDNTLRCICGLGASYYGIFCYASSGNVVLLSTGGGPLQSWAGAWADRAWHTWAFTQSGVGESSTVELYRDGVSLGTASVITSAKTGMRLGASYATTANYIFYGQLDNVAMFSDLLTPSEIQQLYQDPIAPFRLAPTTFFLPATAPDPTPTTASAIVIQSHAEPSLRDGSARSAAECDPRYRSLWDGLRIGWIPALGVQGRQLFNQVSGGANIFFEAGMANSVWAPSDLGWILNNDGNYNLVTTGAPYQDDFSQFTIFALARAQSYVGLQGIFGRNQSEVDGTISMMTGNDANEVRFTVNGVTGTARCEAVHAPMFSGEWASLVGLRHSAASHELHINGEYAHGVATATGSIAGSGSTNWQVLSYGSNEFIGDVAACMFWDRALTPTEIQTLYLDPLAPFRLAPTTFFLPATAPIPTTGFQRLARYKPPLGLRAF